MAITDERFEALEQAVHSILSEVRSLREEIGSMRGESGSMRGKFREMRHDYGDRTDILAHYARLTEQGYFKMNNR